MNAGQKLSTEDFAFISRFLYTKMGLYLEAEKEYLLHTRLGSLITSLRLQGLPALVAALRHHPSPQLVKDVIESMTIHETSFFRDGKPFEDIQRAALARLRAEAGARRQLRIWSAASSTGQEAYSLAISILEDPKRSPDWREEIMGTDISQRVVEKAASGIYSSFEVQRGLPSDLLMKYFHQLSGNSWQVKEKIQQMVSFRQHNLMDDFMGAGNFDLILLRNVLFYFDHDTKALILKRLARCLTGNGLLIIGATESLAALTVPFIPVEGLKGCYRLAQG